MIFIAGNYASLSQNYDENSISTRNVFVPKEDPYAKCKTKGGEQCQFPFHHEVNLKRKLKQIIYYNQEVPNLKVSYFYIYLHIDN